MSTGAAPGNQIVVALAHRGLVEEHLGHLGVRARQVDADGDLGLALLDLDAGQLSEAARHAPAHGAPDSDLSLVLGRLYAGFASEYSQWVPSFGRNRTVERVVGSHTIGGGGEGVPRTVESVDWPAREQGTGRSVVVAVADTAVTPRPELVGGFLAAPESVLLDDGCSVRPATAGHGTFVAGLVLREAPGATVQATRVLGDDGTSDSWDVAKRLVRLSRSGVQVVNLSLGCFTSDNAAPLVLTTAIDRLSPETLVIASAGNHGADRASRPLWPAALDDVVAVGATDDDGGRPDWSPDPAVNPWVDVVARGAHVESTFLSGRVRVGEPGGPGPYGQGPDEVPFTGFASWSGTSFAAARVSGKVAAAMRPGESAASALRRLTEAAPTCGGRPWLG
jgi:membrane-anchored mycosin MYCP